ncbi:MAG: hypothetical protein O2887_01285 [Bacteroidetes bacterium]|nr:hypothetical protein [Bacteroidota bacterium]MDA1119123.1 hypothetical protein [Bacteroidota bacterium]
MDNFKKLIKKRRDEFEIYDLDFDDLWPEIEIRLNKTKRAIEIKWLWRVAAAFIIGVGVTTLLYTKNLSTNEQSLLTYELSPEWAETEQYYTDMISEKIEAIHARNMNLDEVIMQDMELLDQAYADLRKDLEDDADNDEVISAMILNYQVKLEILERILEEIQESKDEQNDEGFNL